MIDLRKDNRTFGDRNLVSTFGSSIVVARSRLSESCGRETEANADCRREAPSSVALFATQVRVCRRTSVAGTLLRRPGGLVFVTFVFLSTSHQLWFELSFSLSESE